jgi:hypothetical protein
MWSGAGIVAAPVASWFETREDALLTMRDQISAISDLILRRREAPSRRMAAGVEV